MKLLIAFIIYLLLSLNSVFAYTIELTESEIDSKIQKRIPVIKRTLFGSIRIDKAHIQLDELQNRIKLRVNLNIDLIVGFQAEGNGVIEGKLSYVPRKGEFYIYEPEIKELEINNIKNHDAEIIRFQMNYLIKKILSKIPIYTLKDSTIKQKLLRATLKSVLVKNKKLFIELDLF